MTIDKPYLVVTEAQKEEIRGAVRIKEDALERDIDSVLEWFKKQQHLPRINLDRRLIENMLISRKGSVEQTKQKIDMMYTIRNVIPDLAALRDVWDPKIVETFKGCTFLVLPKLNHDNTRVSIIRYKDPKFFNLVEIINFTWMVIEYRQFHDYFIGDRYIFDFGNFNLGHFSKYTPTIIRNMELYVRKAFGIRIFGIHIVNAPSILHKMLGLAKMALSEKANSRILVHDTYEDLYKVVDKKIMPAEYGGNEPSVDVLLESWIRELSKEENRDYILSQGKLRANEAFRMGKQMDEEILGISGSFKKLDVD